MRAACKDNQNIIMVKFTITTSRSMILILRSCIFLGSNDDRGWKKFGMWHGNQLFTRNTADMFLCSWSAVMLVNCFAKKVD